MSERLELIDRSQRCEFCQVMAHIHHAPDCPDPGFLAAHPADSAEALLREALERFVTFHSGHVLPDELVQTMSKARAALQASDSRVDQAERLAPSPAAKPIVHTAECIKSMYRGPHVCICGAKKRAAAEGSEPE